MRFYTKQHRYYCGIDRMPDRCTFVHWTDRARFSCTKICPVLQTYSSRRAPYREDMAVPHRSASQYQVKMHSTVRSSCCWRRPSGCVFAGAEVTGDLDPEKLVDFSMPPSARRSQVAEIFAPAHANGAIKHVPPMICQSD